MAQNYNKYTRNLFDKRQKTFASRNSDYSGEEQFGNFSRVADLMKILYQREYTADEIATMLAMMKLDREHTMRRAGVAADDPVRVDSRNDALCYLEIYDYLDWL